MATPISFFDMSVSVTPPTGYVQPLPITVGPNGQPNDLRLAFENDLRFLRQFRTF